MCLQCWGSALSSVHKAQERPPPPPRGVPLETEVPKICTTSGFPSVGTVCVSTANLINEHLLSIPTARIRFSTTDHHIEIRHIKNNTIGWVWVGQSTTAPSPKGVDLCLGAWVSPKIWVGGWVGVQHPPPPPVWISTPLAKGAFSHSVRTAPVITVFTPVTALKTCHL